MYIFQEDEIFNIKSFKMKQVSKFGSLLLLLFVLARCGTGELKTVTTQSGEGYNIVVLSKSGAVKQGKGKYFLEFHKATDNQLVSVGEVNVRAEMQMPGTPMVNDAGVQATNTAGRYEVEYDFSMGGTWTLNIKFDTDKSATISLPVS